MKSENKTKLTLFIKQRLETSGSNYQLAYDAIFRDGEFGHKVEKLAALKFIALYSSKAIGFVKNGALEVLKLEGTPVDKIEMKVMTWE